MMPKKTVWLICQDATPLKYGFGTRHFYLAEEWTKQDYEVIIFTSTFNHFIHTKPITKGNYTYEKIGNVSVYWVKGNEYNKPSGLGRVLSWFVFSFKMLFIKTSSVINKPDVIIVSSPSIFPIINGYLFKQKFKSKLILEVRDIWPLTLTTIGHYSNKHPLILMLSWIEKFAYNKSDYVVSTMPRADLHIKQIIHKEPNFKCVPQGIDQEVIKNTGLVSESFIENNFPKEKFIVGYAGTIGTSNNIHTLIDVARSLQQSGDQKFHFLILGDGYKKDEMIEYAKGLSNVSFLGKIPKVEVNGFLKKCDVLYDGVMAVPLYEYGLSRNKWIDYMLSGRPFVASYTGYVSMINEAKCGVVVPAEDVEALRNALENFADMPKEELDEMGNRGREYVMNNRTFEKLAASFAELFV